MLCMPALMMVTGRYCGRIFIFAPPSPPPPHPPLTTHSVVSRRNVKNHTMGGPIKNCSIQCFDLYTPPPHTLQYNLLIGSFLYKFAIVCLLFFYSVVPENFSYFVTKTVKPPTAYTLQILNTFFM
jgi:hypothetical protein